MSLGFKILMLVVGLGVGFAQVVRASEDFDAEVEESMAERDATTAQAKASRARAEKEEAEAARQKKDAMKVKAAADARHKQAEIELVELEKDIKASRAEQEQHKKDKAAAEKAMAKEGAKLKEGMAFLQKLRGENEALRKLRDEQILKIAALNKQAEDAKADSQKEQLVMETGKKEFDKGKLDLKAAQDRLAAAEIETNKKKADLTAQLEQLKLQYKANKDKTDATDREILDKRRTISRKEEEVKAAEREVKTGEGRMKDAEARLKDLSTTAKGRESEKDMKVEMRAPAAVKLTMSKECGVFDKADLKSKMLGKKKAGSALAGKTSGDWVSYTLKDQRVVYIQKSCF